MIECASVPRIIEKLHVTSTSGTCKIPEVSVCRNILHRGRGICERAVDRENKFIARKNVVFNVVKVLPRFPPRSTTVRTSGEWKIRRGKTRISTGKEEKSTLNIFEKNVDESLPALKRPR